MSAVTVQQAFALGQQHHQAGRLAEAEALYRQILAVQPNHADALHFLGLVAHQRGQNEEAVRLIGQAIAVQPGNPRVHSNLGEAYRALDRLDEAIASHGRAIALDPHCAESHYNLGNALDDLGRLDEAVTAYRRALLLRPDFAESYNNLGVALAGQGQIDEAIAAYHGALQIKPDYPDARSNLGNALARQGKREEAIAAYRRALQARPEFAQAQYNLGNALKDLGRLDEAVAAYRRALQIQPGMTEAHNNLGNALKDQGRLDEAVAAHRRALQIQPGMTEAHNNLGNALKDQGQLDEALGAFRRALQLRPEFVEAHSNLLYDLHFHPGVSHTAIAEEQQRWNLRFGRPQKRIFRSQDSDRNPDRRLRIGYVSPDLRDQVVGRNLLPLFRCHDRLSFEILCYSGAVRPDRITQEFRQYSGQWRDTDGTSDETLAEMIRQDALDILVDLTQHMAGNRLPVFARQPAPVQVSFAGYPESTGLEAIEYRISDRYLEGGRDNAECRMPNDETPREQVLLIDSFWCYDPCGMEIEVNALPAQRTGTITFGSLNNFCKVNESVLKLWARVLGSVKGSRLMFLTHAGSHRQRTVEFLEREGIAAERIEFVAPRPRREYLELYHRLDIALDPFPYNGHTTSLDALWMGVPVVSLAGQQPVARAGLSQLTNLGLPELVAHSEDEYVTIATQLAHDLPRLTELRATLRPRMEASVLMDAPRFARQIEAAYRTIWRQWCAKQAT